MWRGMRAVTIIDYYYCDLHGEAKHESIDTYFEKKKKTCIRISQVGGATHGVKAGEGRSG